MLSFAANCPRPSVTPSYSFWYLVPFLIFLKEMQLFILLLSMIVMSHQHQYLLWAETNIIIYIGMHFSTVSGLILGCVHVLELELNPVIMSCRNEDKPSRMHFKCMLNDHYHFSLFKEYRNSNLPKISLISENGRIYQKTPGKPRQSSEPG